MDGWSTNAQGMNGQWSMVNGQWSMVNGLSDRELRCPSPLLPPLLHLLRAVSVAVNGTPAVPMVNGLIVSYVGLRRAPLSLLPHLTSCSQGCSECSGSVPLHGKRQPGPAQKRGSSRWALSWIVCIIASSSPSQARMVNEWSMNGLLVFWSAGLLVCWSAGLLRSRPMRRGCGRARICSRAQGSPCHARRREATPRAELPQ
jgi:hypothetical protein